MHVQIVTFTLKDLDHDAYAVLCDELAPAFADVPGLTAKTWLADRATNTYGGVYEWESADALAAFTKTELFNAVVSHPNLANLTSTDFAVLDAPSRVTGHFVSEMA